MHSRSSGQEPLEVPAASDPLAAITSLLRPQTILSKVISGAGRWSVRYERHEDPGFCLVLDGSCFLDLDELGVLELHEGDFVLLPATPGFTMASDLEMRPTRVSAAQTRELRHGSKSGPTNLRMLGGYFRFDRANAELLLRLLPALIYVRRGEPGSARIQRVAELIVDEATAARPGRDPILEHLVEVLLIEALRFRPAPTAKEERGLLAGLSDPGLARPLHKIHAHVAKRWTVAELARAAGMSRAVFAERFTRKVGIPPMQYLLEWRMALAKDMIRRNRPPLAEVAERIGYQSASAFSTAFTRLTGVPPSEFGRVAA
ncbi:MAG: AraC family transcriptional regulator [Polyangiaceae bacterium]|nr:AraC family transcriptional regulator [Polyangiaceae bacterium]